MTLSNFGSSYFQAHNSARLTHLASLGLPLNNRRVLEVGSGPGDHTSFYLERGCTVVSIDARQECIDELQRRYPTVKTKVVDMNSPAILFLGNFGVVHAYGILYHLHHPAIAILSMASICSDLLLLETCVAHTDVGEVNRVSEVASDFTQAVDGKGCRPSRKWLFSELKKYFRYVYQTRTQPKHLEFPLDWTRAAPGPLSRVVFVGSRKVLDEKVFSSELLDYQSY